MEILRKYLLPVGLIVGGLTLGFCTDGLTATLRMVERGRHIAALQTEFRQFAESRDKAVTLHIVGPEIDSEATLFNAIRNALAYEQPVDVFVSLAAFHHVTQGRLRALAVPVTESRLDAWRNVIPAIHDSALFRDEAGLLHAIPFMVGAHALAYNADRVEAPPASWNLLWTETAANRFSVGALEPYVNAVVSAWTEDPVDPVLAYDVNAVNWRNLRNRLDGLALNARQLWFDPGNAPSLLRELDYTITRGHDIARANRNGGNWKIARPVEGTPLWAEGISLAATAGDDPEKVEAFYLLTEFLLQPETQRLLMERFGALPIVNDGGPLTPEWAEARPFDGAVEETFIDERFFWKPANTRTLDAYARMWERAKEKRLNGE